MIARGELSDLARTFTIGRRHIRTTIKQNNAIKKSTNLVDDDLTMKAPYHMPRSPNFLAMEFASRRKTTHTTDWNSPIAAVWENWNERIPTR